jgi:hypothetical protein
MSKSLAEMSRKEFVYEVAARALAGHFANPTPSASVASMVRDADKLWKELEEWQELELQGD